MFFLRSMFPVLLEDTAVVETLLAQVLQTARDRTVQVVAISQDRIDRLCRETRERSRLSLEG